MASRTAQLFLSNNSLRSVRGLEAFSGLTCLSLSRNLVRRTADLLPLASLPRLETLSLEGSPVCGAANYRAHVISLAPPRFRTLDRREVCICMCVFVCVCARACFFFLACALWTMRCMGFVYHVSRLCRCPAWHVRACFSFCVCSGPVASCPLFTKPGPNYLALRHDQPLVSPAGTREQHRLPRRRPRTLPPLWPPRDPRLARLRGSASFAGFCATCRACWNATRSSGTLCFGPAAAAAGTGAAVGAAAIMTGCSVGFLRGPATGGRAFRTAVGRGVNARP